MKIFFSVLLLVMAMAFSCSADSGTSQEVVDSIANLNNSRANLNDARAGQITTRTQDRHQVAQQQLIQQQYEQGIENGAKKRQEKKQRKTSILGW